MENNHPLSHLQEMPLEDLEDPPPQPDDLLPEYEPVADKELDLCTLIGCTNDFY